MQQPLVCNCIFNGLLSERRRYSILPGRRYPWVAATTWWSMAHGSCDESGCSLDAFKYDFAVVRVGEPIGQTRGYLGLKYNVKSQGYSVTSAG